MGHPRAAHERSLDPVQQRGIQADRRQQTDRIGVAPAREDLGHVRVHVVPQILEAFPIAIGAGLRLPLVYNTSAYDSDHRIRLMDDVVDVYMPDFKLWKADSSRALLAAADYPEAARRVIPMMHRQVGELKVDEDDLAREAGLWRFDARWRRVAPPWSRGVPLRLQPRAEGAIGEAFSGAGPGRSA